MISIKDKEGESYDGSKTYRLRVRRMRPSSSNGRSLPTTGRPIRSSSTSVAPAARRTAPRSRRTLTVDLYFGPKARAGSESNWVPTDSIRGFELMVRFYAPTKALFDKAWKLSDVEKMT